MNAPWTKPIRVLKWPNQPEENCGSHLAHRAHSWETVVEPDNHVSIEEALEPSRAIQTERHYCKGNGHLRGYL